MAGNQELTEQDATTEANERLFRFAVIDGVWNRANVALVDEHYAPDVIFHTQAVPEPICGRAGYKEFITRIRSGFPDLHLTIEDVIAQGDFVVGRIGVRMTHLGVYEGVPPTGKLVETTQVLITRFEDGMLKEAWQEIDALRLLRQIGAMPAPGIGPFGLIAWSLRTVARFALLHMRGRTRAG